MSYLSDSERGTIGGIATAAFMKGAGLPELMAEIDREVIEAWRDDAERLIEERLVAEAES